MDLIIYVVLHKDVPRCTAAGVAENGVHMQGNFYDVKIFEVVE